MDTTALPSAPLWRRLAAALYDLFPLLALWMGAGALWIGVAKALSTGPRAGVEDMGHWAVGNWAYFGYLVLVAFAYYALSWRRGGQTLGMRAWRVVLRGDDGVAPGWGRLALRFVVGIVGTAAAGLGLWWAAFDKRGRAWHDIAARTVLILLPPRGK